MPRESKVSKRLGVPLVQKATNILGPASVVGAGLVVVIAPLALGGVSATAHVVLAACAFFALILHLLARSKEGRSLRISWTIAPFVLAAAATAVMLIPLPEFLLLLLDAETTELKTWTTKALSAEAQMLVLPVLAVDPPETGLALVRIAAATSLFLVIADRTQRRTNRRLFFRILLVGGITVLSVSLFHRFANLDGIYGIYGTGGTGAPSLRTPLQGPLVNSNHLARMFGGFSFLGLASIPLLRNRTEMVFVGCASAVLGAAVFFTASRGGMLAYVGVCALACVSWLSRRRSGARPGSPANEEPRAGALVPLIAIFGIGFAMFLGREIIVEQLATLADSDLKTSKAMLYEPALRVLSHHPLLGVGPGGFRNALPPLLAVGELPELRYTHVENLPLEILASHGFIFGAGILALCAATAWHLLRMLPSTVDRISLLALAFLALGELFDFVLQIPAGLFLAAAALGLSTGKALEKGSPCWRFSSKPAGLLAGTIGLALAGGIWTGFSADRRRIDAALLANNDDKDSSNENSKDEYQAIIGRALARHPLDPYYAYLLSRNARTRQAPKDAMKWANRAMTLDPNNGSAHREAARVLWANGAIDQALLEYRIAWRVAPQLRSSLGREVARRTQSVDLRLRAVPATERAFFSICEQVRFEKTPDRALHCWDRAIHAFPGTPSSVPSNATKAASFRLGAARAAIALKDGAGARKRLAPLLRGGKIEGSALRVHLDAVALEEGVAKAYAEALRLRPQVEQRAFDVLQWQINAAGILGLPAERLRLIGEARGLASHRERLQLERIEARVLESSGRKGDALVSWRKIATRLEGRASALAQQARLELDLGMLEHAELSLNAIARADPRSRQLQKLKKRLLRLKEERAEPQAVGR